MSSICPSNSVVIRRVAICCSCCAFKQQLSYPFWTKFRCNIFCHSSPRSTQTAQLSGYYAQPCPRGLLCFPLLFLSMLLLCFFFLPCQWRYVQEVGFMRAAPATSSPATARIGKRQRLPVKEWALRLLQLTHKLNNKHLNLT